VEALCIKIGDHDGRAATYNITSTLLSSTANKMIELT